MRNAKKKVLLYLLLAILLGGNIWGFGFEPITKEFEPSGTQAMQTFRAVNESDKPIAVQIRMVRREMDIDGVETLPDASNEFTVYPSQLIIPAESFQTVRVQWRGTPRPAKELAYRIIAEQLPIQLTEQRTSGITILFRYLGSVYVVPSDAEADVSIVSAASKTAEDGSPAIEIIAANNGTAHALLLDLELTVKSNGGSTALMGPEQLVGVTGENVLAGNRRRGSR